MAHRERTFRRSLLRTPGFLLALAWSTWKAAWLALVQAVLFRKIGDAQAVAIYRIGSIGDLMQALPAMGAIRKRHPDARLTLVTNASGAVPWATRLGIDAALNLSVVSYNDPHELRQAVR